MRARNVFLLVAASAVMSVSQAAVFQFPTATYYNPFLTSTLSEGSPTFTLLTPSTELNTQWLPNKFIYSPAENGWVIDLSSDYWVVEGQPAGAVSVGSIGTLNNLVEVQAVGTGTTVDTGTLGLTATAPAAPQNPEFLPAGQVVISSDVTYPVALGVASNGGDYAGLSLSSGPIALSSMGSWGDAGLSTNSGLGYALAESEVPEPSSLLLALLGMASVVLACVKRKQAHSR